VKIFDKAALRLTIVYTTILMSLSLGFSAAFYAVVSSELDRPISSEPSRSYTLRLPNDNLQIVVRERDNEIRSNLVFSLVFINTAILIAGATISYFLARLTLRPINRAMDAQGRFVSDASHELRTPLTAMAMENEVALRDSKITKDDLKKLVKSNMEELDQVSRLVDRLLSLSRNEKLPLENVDITHVVQGAVEKLGKVYQSKHVNIKVQIAPIKLQANAEALEQILVILIDNAIKYSPENSTVKVTTSGNTIYVSDEGSGIAHIDLPHIFERFYRSEKSRTSKGYGLGLPLAQHLATQMGLTIHATNNRDKGATFLIK
jgi:signal transduction histidine kinase